MVASKHVLEQPTPPSKLNSDVSPALEAVIMKALSKNPDNRYSDADEMRADLERARLGQAVQATPLLPESARTQRIAPTGPPTAVLPPVQPGDGGRRRWWIPALIVLLILAVLGGGLYLLASSLLSTNATRVKVPNVVGSREDAARRDLIEAGFRVDPVTRVTSNPSEVGIVIEQSPDPETFLEKGETVTITIGKAPAQVEVPDLSGMTQDEAVAALERAHLSLGTVETQPSDLPEGTVVSQNPIPGDKVDKNSAVDVVLSAGPSDVTVPDVVCESLGKAESELDKAGFQVVVSEEETQFNFECPKDGRVAAQDPPGDSSAPSGSTVTLIPSTGVSPTSPSPSPTSSP
jgi:beta-lactam-binding protein with PASTA domain